MAADSSERYVLLNRLAEEFAQRYRRGERPSLKEYIDRHPDLAADIREFFPALVEMEQVKADRQEVQGPPADGPLPPLQRLGDYRIIREIGHGGMGVVYEAEQVSLGRHVALKVLPQQLLVDARTKRRFEREAKAAAKLHHTNIVPVFGVGEHEGLPYYVMQFIQGLGLDAVLEELQRLQGGSAGASAPRDSRREVSAADVARSLLTGYFAPTAEGDEPAADQAPPSAPPATGRRADTSSLSGSSVALPGSVSQAGKKQLTYWQSVARIGVQVADALEHAHKQGIQHRDVKPSNLLLDTAGTVWVTDFGLAKADDQQNLTHTGDVLGTLRYMSPEAFDGKTDARSDVYSLGLTLYELLALRPAFDEQEPNKLIKQVATTEPARLDGLNRGVPRDLVTIVHKAIERDPARRYPTAGELGSDLQRFLDDEPIQARPVGRLERAWRWMRRRPATAALLAVSAVAALALVGVVVGLLYNRELQQAQERTQNALQAESAARQQAEMFQYFHHVGRAHAEWRDGSMGRVEPLLDAAPKGHRGWEWHYLKRLCGASALTLRASGGVQDVAFSPDGTRLASAGKAVQLWDVRTSEEMWTFPAPVQDGLYRGVAFSPDGIRLAAACADGRVRCWEVATGRSLPTLQGHGGTVHGVAFSPDGSRLASSSEDRTVRVWDPGTGRLLDTFQGDAEFFKLAFSPDGTQVAVGGGDRAVTVWDAATGQKIHCLLGHTGKVTVVAFSPDGTRLASGSWDNAVKVWDLAAGKELFTLRGHAGYVRGLAFSPDGALLASAGVDQTIKVWDTRTREEAFTLKGHRSEVMAVAFSPDGARLASSSADTSVRLWAVTPRQEVLTLAGHAGAVRGVAFSPDGTRLASAGMEGTVRVWDAGTGQELHRLSRGAAVPFHGVAFSLEGRRLAAAGGDGSVLLWDPASAAEPLALRQHTGPVWAVAFSPDGAWLASAGTDRTVRIWDAKTGQPAVVCEGHTAPVLSLAFSPDGKRLASGGEDRTVRVWEVATGREVLPEPICADTVKVWSVAFSPNGQQLASGSWQNRALLWDAATGRSLGRQLIHSSDVLSVAFSPDGKRLASASVDQTVKLWDTATAQEAISLRGHAGRVWAVAFSPDGSRLASASEDQTVKVWDATALTPEVRAERDALALLDFLFARPLPKVDVIAHLRNTPTIDPQAPKRALALVERYREETDPRKYHDAAWPVIRHPYANVFTCRFALAQMNAACKRAPDHAPYRIALGIAQYRLGKFQKERYPEALRTLTRCDQSQPATLAFLAMTQHRLGQKEARTTLARLRESVKEPPWAANEETAAFLREATELIEGKKDKSKK